MMANFAPLRVSNAFKPSVVPWLNISMSSIWALTFSNAPITPLVGASGVVGTLSKISSPVDVSNFTTSVKVPPTSTAIRVFFAMLLFPFCDY